MQKRYPFKFLDAYTREDHDFFFGRTDEIESLYEMVFQTDLLLVYGASGTGKTSLIQCGLASKLQSHDWLALNIRRGSDLNASFEKALDDAGGGAAGQPGDNLDWLDEDWTSDASNDTLPKSLSQLARRFKAIYLKHFKPLYLIFDQFEELYILGNKTEQNQFIQTVREILLVEQPVKIILSIREEYLGYLYEFERAVPELLRKKLRVEPMNLDKVITVIKNVGDSPKSNVRLQNGEDDALATGIFEKIRGEEKSLSIQLPYLQVFLDKLYLQVTGDETRHAEAVFTPDALDNMGTIGDVLRNFLDEQVLLTAQKLNRQPENIWHILSPFVTLEGTKEPLSAAQLSDRLPDVPPALIDQTLQAFVNSRILRYTEQEQLYEIAHDSLAKQIHDKRNDDEIAILEVQRLIKSQTALKVEAREFFTEKQLLFIEPYLDKFRSGVEEMDWIEQSRVKVQAEKAAAEAAIEKRRKTALRTAIVATFLVLAAVIATVFAFWKTKQAAQAAGQAVIALVDAARKDILQLRYDAAFSKMKDAAELGSVKDSVAFELMEIAFFRHYSGQSNQTAESFELAAQLLGKTNVSIKNGFDDALAALDKGRSNLLISRYFPEMAEIKGGTFNMGSDNPEDSFLGSESTKPLHNVTISDFKMAKTETTVWQYNLYLAYQSKDIYDPKVIERPGWGWEGDNPVVNVSWYDAQFYANWLSRQQHLSPAIDTINGNFQADWNVKSYRLPTESEWEYAARGAAKQDNFSYSGSPKIEEVAWFGDNSGNRTHAVAARKINGSGVYDMSGNVWEWCWDWYGKYSPDAATNPIGPDKGGSRVYRGGCWSYYALLCRVAYRSDHSPAYRSYYLGFRLVRPF